MHLSRVTTTCSVLGHARGLPQNLEMEERFNTEAACVEYLQQLRWPEGFVCPRCGTEKSWQTCSGLYRCQRCELETSVTAGTILHRTRKPLRLWFRAM
ncbi:hypothetical protein ES705_43911 [subsurface metagenome]